MSAIETWLAHRPPFLFVDEMWSVEGEVGLFSLHLHDHDTRLRNGRLEPLFLVEALAQGMAAFDGYKHPGVAAAGMLAEVQARFHGAAKAGDVVKLEVRRTREIRDLARFVCRAEVAGVVLVEAQIVVKRALLPPHA